MFAKKQHRRIERMREEQHIHQIKQKLFSWMRWSGYVTLGFGIISSLFGFIQFLGFIFGILLIGASIPLLRASKQVALIREETSHDDSFRLISDLLQFFRWHLISMIVVIFLAISTSVWIIHFLSNWDWLIHLIQYGKHFDFILTWIEKLWT